MTAQYYECSMTSSAEAVLRRVTKDATGISELPLSLD